MKETKTWYSQEPEKILYMPQKNGSAQAWLRKDIESYKDEEGNESYTANEVYIETRLTKEEIEAQFDSYFYEEPVTTIEDLVEAIDFLAELVMA